MQGLATVLITVEPEESMQARPPRALAPGGFTVGHSLGRANDAALQRQILTDALALLEQPLQPGTLVTRDYYGES